jgi:gamma-tubulin complex component 3
MMVGVEKNQPGLQVREEDLIRDLLFVFQGIDGRLIQYSVADDAFVLLPSLMISTSARKIVSELCELGWLFKKVNDWLNLNVENVGALEVNQVT